MLRTRKTERKRDKGKMQLRKKIEQEKMRMPKEKRRFEQHRRGSSVKKEMDKSKV